nr:dynamin family protein [uncultured Campylobacter sp.]
MKIAVCGGDDKSGGREVIDFVFGNGFRTTLSAEFNTHEYDNNITVIEFARLPDVKTDLQGDDVLFYIFSANDLSNGFKELSDKAIDFLKNAKKENQNLHIFVIMGVYDTNDSIKGNHRGQYVYIPASSGISEIYNLRKRPNNILKFKYIKGQILRALGEIELQKQPQKEIKSEEVKTQNQIKDEYIDVKIQKSYEPLISSGISEDFDSFIEYISFIKDISNDHGVSSNEELRQHLSSLAGAAKVIISDEVKMLDSAYKAEVVVIGDFSAGKSSFINSLIGKEVCPVNSAATTSSVTKFIFSFDERIINKTDGKTIDAREYKKLVTHQGDTKATYELDYYYPFTPLRGVNLYDTPGFANATGQGDTQLTMKKAKEADAALLLVDINTGSVNDALRGKVSELQKANPDMLFYAVLNKADTKSPSARRKVKDEVMKNFDFFKGCYVYSCAPDAESVDVETAKREIMDDLTHISEAKYKIKTPKFSKDKAEFETDLLSTLKDVKDRLTELTEFNLELKIEDWSEIEKKYKEMAGKVSIKCDETLVQNQNKKSGLGDFLEGILPGGITEIVKDISDTYYHDLYILINEEYFKQQVWDMRDAVFQQLDKDGIGIEFVTEEISEDFINNFFDSKMSYYCNDILRVVNENPQHLIDIESWSDALETNTAKIGCRRNIEQAIVDNFEFFQWCVNSALEDYNCKIKELNNKDKQHYQNTNDKIDDFIAFIKQNEKNRKLNLKEKK